MTQHAEFVGGRRLNFVSLLKRLGIGTPIQWNYVIFWSFSLILLISIGMANRYGMLDNRHNLNYFQKTDLNWFLDFFSLAKDNTVLFFAFFTEEFLWRVWAFTLGSFFSEDQAVYITVILLNLLIISALSRTLHPILALVLWILIPQALATVGTYQIRQGFALSIMLYMTLSLKRPIIGCLLASAIHTTFIIPLIYSLIFKVAKRLKWSITHLLTLYFFVALFLVISGNQLFEDYGGRRVKQYAIDEGASSINFVFGALLCTVPSTFYLFQSKERMTPTTELAAIHVGCIVFLMLSWLLFPIGTARISYYIFLFLIPVVSALRLRTRAALAVLLFTLMLLAYFIIKSYLVGGAYDEILWGWGW